MISMGYATLTDKFEKVKNPLTVAINVPGIFGIEYAESCAKLFGSHGSESSHE
jgi:hypothetical protein